MGSSAELVQTLHHGDGCRGRKVKVNQTVGVVLLNALMTTNLLYVNGADLSHLELSPLFGNFS